MKRGRGDTARRTERGIGKGMEGERQEERHNSLFRVGKNGTGKNLKSIPLK